jgi:hypothetical protein
VLAKASEALRIDPDKIDRSKTIKGLAETGETPMAYAYFVVDVGESLGFDSAAAFYAKAIEKGSTQPWDSLTIEELQTISREKYLKGTDAPPRPVNANAEYQIGAALSVRVPIPNTGWYLLRCTTQQIVFQRLGDTRAVSTAQAGYLSLPAFEDDQRFSEYTRSVANSTLARLGHIRSLEVHTLTNGRTPCALVEATIDRGASPYLLFARYCYRDKRTGAGDSTTFSHVGTVAMEAIRTEAMSFFAGAAPK